MPIFGELLTEIHHIGSTAVPKLCAKPEIDILVVVDAPGSDLDWSEELSNLGYTRGGDLSVGHQFYKINRNSRRTHKLHVCTAGHEQIKKMIQFRDLLRSNQTLRRQYAVLKRDLEQSNRRGIAEYLEKKDPFISRALKERSNNNV